MNRDLAEVINQLVEERGLDRNILSSIICEGIYAAYQKKYPDLELKVDYNKKTGETEIKVKKLIASSVENEDSEISLRKAKNIDPEAALGQGIWVDFDGKIGRIETLKAKQVISEKIKSIEYDLIHKAFKNKEGSIVYGVVHRCEKAGALIKIGDSLAFLPNSLSIPGEKCSVGHPIRALLKEVLASPRNESQLVLDRKSPEFLKGLFELEIPEVFEKLVEVKKIVRIAGYKAKIAVVSHDSNIDPVGTCVGVNGARIKPILKEISGEKVDIIRATDSVEEFIKDALKPAQIDKVELLDKKSALVWLPEDQRSAAIGKLGQNINLASQLTGIDIQLADIKDSKRDENKKSINLEDI